MFTLRFDMRAPDFGAPSRELYATALEIAEWSENKGAISAVICEHHGSDDGYLPAPMILPPVPELVDLAEAKLLIADDVADTGRTLALVRDFCAGKVAEVRTAVLYEKPTSVVVCDYVWRRTSAWITFPWSAQPPVSEALAQSGRPANG